MILVRVYDDGLLRLRGVIERAMIKDKCNNRWLISAGSLGRGRWNTLPEMCENVFGLRSFVAMGRNVCFTHELVFKGVCNMCHVYGNDKAIIVILKEVIEIIIV